jgi:hypothetical protein
MNKVQIKFLSQLSIFISLNILCITNVYAYLDPGTGSIIIQGIIAASLSAIFVIKTYWFKLRSMFNKKSKNE